MADQYTHDFIYRLGDGSHYILGEVEFNKDKKVSYRIKKWAEPLDHETMEAFIGFIQRLKERFDQFDGIKHVQIIEKGYVDPGYQ